MPKIIIASGPVIMEEGKILLNISENDSFWAFPGGKTENNELLCETAKREVKEEMGLEIEILDPNPFFFYTTKKTAEEEIDIILVHYLAKRLGEIAPGDDIREWKWIPLEDLEKENLAPNIIPTLKHFGFLV